MLAGGRKKAGGIAMTSSPEEVEIATRKMLGIKIVTEQTGKEGLEVKAVGVAEQVRVLDEMYLAFL